MFRVGGGYTPPPNNDSAVYVTALSRLCARARGYRPLKNCHRRWYPDEIERTPQSRSIIDAFDRLLLAILKVHNLRDQYRVVARSPEPERMNWLLENTPGRCGVRTARGVRGPRDRTPRPRPAQGRVRRPAQAGLRPCAVAQVAGDRARGAPIASYQLKRPFEYLRRDPKGAFYHPWWAILDELRTT